MVPERCKHPCLLPGAACMQEKGKLPVDPAAAEIMHIVGTDASKVRTAWEQATVGGI
jgi:hypothetical protein